MMSSPRLIAPFVLLILASVACVTATPRAYRDAEHLPPRDPEDVEVFWIPPAFVYRPVGEVSVRACPACTDEQIETEIRKAVAQIGGDLALIATDATSTGGAVLVPGPYTASVVPVRHRDLRVVAALRQESRPTEPPEPTQAAADRSSDAPALITFECVPVDADIFVNELFVGACPLIDYPLPSGNHEVRVEASGYAPWTRQLLATSGTAVRVRALLTRYP